MHQDEATMGIGCCGAGLRRLGRTQPSLGIAEHVRLAASCMAETLWPTRCVVCGRPGEVLCPGCRMRVACIDQWMACPRCGAPFGKVQCTECNTYAQRSMPQWKVPRGRLPFDRCVSVAVFDEVSARIVRGYKDAGEQRLAQAMAWFMACAIPPEWLVPGACLASVPATRAAVRRRGFDHMQAVQAQLGALLDLPCCRLLAAGRVHDQRGLGREQRFDNMRGCFHALEGPAGKDACVVLADDVYTTGATLMSAAETLRDQGFCKINCVTFARVY